MNMTQDPLSLAQMWAKFGEPYLAKARAFLGPHQKGLDEGNAVTCHARMAYMVRLGA